MLHHDLPDPGDEHGALVWSALELLHQCLEHGGHARGGQPETREKRKQDKQQMKRSDTRAEAASVLAYNTIYKQGASASTRGQ